MYTKISKFLKSKIFLTFIYICRFYIVLFIYSVVAPNILHLVTAFTVLSSFISLFFCNMIVFQVHLKFLICSWFLQCFNFVQLSILVWYTPQLTASLPRQPFSMANILCIYIHSIVPTDMTIPIYVYISISNMNIEILSIIHWHI